jgi:hypothetical protein
MADGSLIFVVYARKGGLTKGVEKGFQYLGLVSTYILIRLRVFKLRYFSTLHERIENCQVQGIVRISHAHYIKGVLILSVTQVAQSYQYRAAVLSFIFVYYILLYNYSLLI